MSFQPKNKAICRVCTRNQPDTTPIFNTATFSEQLLAICEVITTCASVQIYESDGLPEHICTECFDGLHQAYSFRKLCEKSDCELRSQLSFNEEIKTEKDEPELIDIDYVTNTEEVKFEFTDHQITTDNIHIEERAIEPEVSSAGNDIINMENYKRENEISKGDIEQDKIEEKSSETTCKVCNKSLTNLSAHIRSHPSPCSDCGKQFLKRRQLKRHKLTHKQTKRDYSKHKQINFEKSHECGICSKVFANAKYLKDHTDRHGTEKNSMCELCGKKFPNAKLLSTHKLWHEEAEHKCDVCNKVYKLQTSLAKHKKIHTGEKFGCEECGKQFTQKSYLKNHVKIHTGEKPFACEFCDKRFAMGGNLVAHRTVHTGERPYACETCDKRFATRGNLIVHKRVHTGETPYVCDICSRAFKMLSTYRKHLRFHTGLKPYECSICKQTFSDNYNMKSHMKLHSRTHECRLCRKKFEGGAALQKHSEIHELKKRLKKRRL